MSYLHDLDKKMRETDPKFDRIRAVDAFIADLAKVRRERGLTQAQVAHVAGIRQSHVSRIENYESEMVSFATILRYANAVGMSVKLVNDSESIAMSDAAQG
jgi:transcriptional regulator with XRE-family HTH domain